jgi:hypothetical protein
MPGVFERIGTSNFTVVRGSVDPRCEVFDKTDLQTMVIV